MWTAPFSLWWPKYLHNVDSSSSPLVAPLVLTMWTAPFSVWWTKYLHNVDSSIFPLVAKVLTQCGQLQFPSGGSSGTYNVDSSIFLLVARVLAQCGPLFSLWWLLEYLHNVDSSIFPLVAWVLAECGPLYFPSGGSSSTCTMWTAPVPLWWTEYLHNEVIRQYDSCNTGELDQHAQHQQPCLARRTLRVIVRQEQPVLSGTHWSSFARRQMSVVLCLRRFPMKIENCHIRHQRPPKVHQRMPR